MRRECWTTEAFGVDNFVFAGHDFRRRWPKETFCRAVDVCVLMSHISGRLG